MQWKDGDFIIKHDTLNNYLKKHPNFVGTSAFIDELTSIGKNFQSIYMQKLPCFFSLKK